MANLYILKQFALVFPFKFENICGVDCGIFRCFGCFWISLLNPLLKLYWRRNKFRSKPLKAQYELFDLQCLRCKAMWWYSIFNWHVSKYSHSHFISLALAMSDSGVAFHSIFYINFNLHFNCISKVKKCHTKDVLI